MSGNTARLPLIEAEAVALEAAKMLRPACESLDIAGSVRRRAATCGDVEIVCRPKIERDVDLFGTTLDTGGWNDLDALCTELLLAGVLSLRPDVNGRTANGSRHKRLAYRDFPLDLFAVIEPASYGSILAIRTGPRWFSKALVVPENKQVYDDEGRPLCAGLMPAWLLHRDGHYQHATTGETYPTPAERDVFDLIALPWIEPADRDAFMTDRIARFSTVAGACRSEI